MAVSRVAEYRTGHKPRPALSVSVERRVNGDVVSIAYGTPEYVNRLKGERPSQKSGHGAADDLAGLAYDTNFDFKVIVDLPWSDRYFQAPPRKPFGSNPKLGTRHATIPHTVEAAYRAAKAR